MITIYTDGSCLTNPGSGGWAAIINENNKKKIISGNEKNTTNNRMELLAPINALRGIKPGSKIKIYTDSQYVKNGITEWINNWKSNGWKTANKKSVKNQELWKELDQLTSRHYIEWKWVKGHSGHPGNERADELANEAIDKHANS